MTKVIIELEVCPDCLMVIANGDYSGIDYYLNGQEADDRCKAIDDGMADWQGYGGRLVACDSESSSFSKTPCDCCGDDLHGDRYPVNLLK